MIRQSEKEEISLPRGTALRDTDSQLILFVGLSGGGSRLSAARGKTKERMKQADGSGRRAPSAGGGRGGADKGGSAAPPARDGFVAERVYRELDAYLRHAPSHQAILSERNLARRHGVSVGTVRRALARLVGEGRVYKVHGKGNFIVPRPPAKRILYADAWGDTLHPFYVRSLGAMAAEADRHGYRLEILPYHPDGGVEAETLLRREAADPAVRALIVPWLRRVHFETLRAACPDVFLLSATAELPFPGTASVVPDWHAGGRMAADYLSGHGARRLACLTHVDEFLQGMQQRLAHHPEVAVSVLRSDDRADPVALAAALAADAFDGLAFQNDRLASATLGALASRHPRFWKRCRTVSMANAGERILPPDTARLEIDGKEIGLTAVTVIRAMEAGRFRGACVRIHPVLAPPEGSEPHA